MDRFGFEPVDTSDPGSLDLYLLTKDFEATLHTPEVLAQFPNSCLNPR